jgi:hypothetical protein
MLALDFVVTSLSSIFANVVTHPAETVKTRQQLRNVSASQVLREAYASGTALSSLYRGFSASLVRAVISGGGRQTLYYGLKSSLLSQNNESGSARVALGVVAGMFAAGLAAPIDLVRTRQQVDVHMGSSVSIISILKSVYAEENGLRGLWRGSSAVFARQALLNGSQLASYDRAKAAIADWSGSAPDTIVTQASAAAVAGGVATASIAPVEFVKTQMQSGVQGGVLQVAVRSVRERGFGSLWRGSLALWLKLAPHTLIVLLSTDALRAACGIPIII